MYCEGILEHFFSKHLSYYNEDDIKWYFNFLADPTHLLLKSTLITSDIAKFFLKRILTVKKPASQQNILCLFEDKVCNNRLNDIFIINIW